MLSGSQWDLGGNRESGKVRMSVVGVGLVSWQGTAVERSGAWRGRRRTCWVRKEEQGREPLHHARLPVCVFPSTNTLHFPLAPIHPRLVFHPCPSGCNGVPECLNGWRLGPYWHPRFECNSFPSKSAKIRLIAKHHTGGNVALFRWVLVHFRSCFY